MNTHLHRSLHAVALAAGLAAMAVPPAAHADDEPPAVASDAPSPDWQWSAKLRLQWDQRGQGSLGPLVAANQIMPGTYTPAPNGATARGEWQAQGRHWQGSATVQQTQHGGAARAWLNEAAVHLDSDAWRWSAGKKIVSWDVGYGFRPNDLVQQEERRTLVSSTPEGRGVLMAERFDADTAWSWVWVNPTHARSERGAAEPALAARLYQRRGALDLHGFARVGARTGASLGAALAWVASDATELHASWRTFARSDTLRGPGSPYAMERTSPWLATQTGHGSQALLGATWTHESQLSLMFEAWWDGTAASSAQWRDWQVRNAALVALSRRGIPAAAVAGNLAWQADAFGAAGNLEQRNLYLRLSWEHEGWQPTFDMLYHPADGGRLYTAGLLYKGDRQQVQAVLRSTAGPRTSLMAQLPTVRQANLTWTWNF